jgi:hypothetical protein
MRYNTLQSHKKHFQSFTGLTVNEFNILVSKLRDDWQEHTVKRLDRDNPKRQRKRGGGRKKILETLEDQLLLALVWSKLYSSYLVLEYLFSVDESTVCRTIQETIPLLQNKFILPKRRRGKKITTIQELKELIPDLDAILGDATEQRIPRPLKKQKRKKHHSGKKKAFTIKTQIATNERGLIVHVSQPTPGRAHDYKVFKASDLPQIIPKGTKAYFDSGYQGIHADYPTMNAVIPFKKTRGHQKLTRSEKIHNTKQRKIRVAIEHTIAHLKKYTALASIYRHSLQNYERVFRFIANIVNFRMLQRMPITL